MQAILYNIRSVHNVGSMFRTADGAGVEKLWLAGFTPMPLNRLGEYRKDFQKVALGAEESVEWEKVGEESEGRMDEVLALINNLKAKGTKVVAVEQTPESLVYNEVNLPEDTCFIFGHEVEGVPPELVEAADMAIEIPMAGAKKSLNVSVAFGVVAYLPRAQRTTHKARR